MDVGARQENQAVISSTTAATVNFCEVESVAKSWMIDFNFLSLCRYFKEQNAESFSKTLKVFEGKRFVCQQLYYCSFFRLPRCNWSDAFDPLR